MTEPSQIEQMKRYLFREMPEKEREAIEDRFFEDTEFFYELTDLENDLVDRYVGGKLTNEDLVRFEQSLEKIPERREKIANARALQAIIAEEKNVAVLPFEASLWQKIVSFFNLQTFGLRLVAGTLAVLLICVFGFLIYRNWQKQNDFAEIEKRRETERIEKENRLKQLEEEQKRIEQERRQPENSNDAIPQNNDNQSSADEQKRKNEIEKLKKDVEDLRQRKDILPPNRKEIKPSKEFLAVNIFPTGRGGVTATAELIDDKSGKQKVKITIELSDGDDFEAVEIVSKNGTESKKIAEGTKSVVFYLPPNDTEIEINAAERGGRGLESVGSFELKLTKNKK